MHGMTADRLHALEEKHGGKAAPADLVLDIPRVFLNPDRLDPLGEVRVAELASRQFGPQKPTCFSATRALSTRPRAAANSRATADWCEAHKKRACEHRSMHPHVQGGLSARIHYPQGDARQESRWASQGHREPQGPVHTPGEGPLHHPSSAG